ncbi:endonuclease/exonuclease/phosphatase family protein [Paracoccus jiaweipingae]|uniref:endonuclease/exonuclease/phosphatase family protein n=1 Tax=unclassified Paracoccus (in: a-proteobacteria) TaxID=2688777 RepID=UPI00378DE520
MRLARAFGAVIAAALTTALAAAPVVSVATPAAADRLRLASFDPGLTRKGPGLLLRDIQRGKDDQIDAALTVIVQTRPDILLLTGIDWDYDNLALTAFADRLRDAGLDYAHLFAARPNSGMATGIDLNGDGRRGRSSDAQGYGQFTGQGGMAVLSRFPLDPPRDHSAMLWRDLPGNLIGQALSPQAAQVQRLSSVAHWDVPVRVGQTTLHLLAFSATPPVFDGPEDRNGRRNHDEIAFWTRYDVPGPFVVMGNANLDPVDGEGRHQAIRDLLARTGDPRPRSAGAALAPQTGANAGHRGDPALDTASWGDKPPGNLRVDYVLPSRGLNVTDAGVFWPAPDQPLAELAARASVHRLVWVDVVIE